MIFSNRIEQAFISKFNLNTTIISKNNQQSNKMDDWQKAIERLATQMAQLAKEKDELEKHVKKQDEKIAKLEEKQAKEQGKMEQIASQNGTLMKLLEGQLGKMEEVQKKRANEQKLQLTAEYTFAKLIGVPTVANLASNYSQVKLLLLIKNGNGITESIYIQENQKFTDQQLVQAIVDLLATTDKPWKLIGEVTIERGTGCFLQWPQNGELKLKERKANVAITLNEASASPSKRSGFNLEEYKLANKGVHFQVLLYYPTGSYQHQVDKFVYRRLE